MLKKFLGYFKKEMDLNKEYNQSSSSEHYESILTSNGKLSFAEKERIMVQRVTTEDMVQFESMPYQLNDPVHKLIEEHTHPFAYINLSKANISIAKAELNKINARIAADSTLAPMIPCSLRIPLDSIVFAPSKERGYTRIICTPYTFDGEISKYPISLVFMTNLYEQADTTHGTLFYNQDGDIAKADIYFWRGNEGFFFYYETLNRSFVLSKVELSRPSSVYQPNVILYKDQYWIDLEATRKKEACDFEWLQAHIPDKCPKSVAGFRRMKHSKTANYQKLVARAKELGRIIE